MGNENHLKVMKTSTLQLILAYIFVAIAAFSYADEVEENNIMVCAILLTLLTIWNKDYDNSN